MGLFEKEKKDVGRSPMPVAAPAKPPETAPKGLLNRTVITANVSIRGEIDASDDVVIEGTVEGHVQSRRSVIVGPQGRVYADIQAQVIEVHGYVQGNLKAHERLRLGENARVEGDIVTSRLAVEEKAFVKGRIEMRTETSEAREAEVEASSG
jgi:cytoskeletal protein CcmA (bactofilin family)